MIKVGLIVSHMAPGGAERTVATWLRHIDRSQVTPTLFLLSRSGALLGEVPEDVEIVALTEEPTPLGFFKSLRLLVTALRARLAEQDLLVGTCVATHALGWAASVVVRRPFVAWVHYVWGRLLFEGPAGKFMRLAYTQISDYVFVSQEAKTHFLRGAPSRVCARYHVIHNPLAVAEGDSLSLSRLCAEEQVRGGPVILFVGRLVRVKDVAALLRSVAVLRKKIPSAFLAVVGDGPERPGLERLNAVLQAEEAMAGDGDGHLPAVFLGADPAPAAVMRRACALAITSEQEAWGMVALEAADLGTPVVGFDCPGGLRELMGPAADLIPGRDESALAGRILALVTSASERQASSWRGRLRAKDFYPERVMPAWVALFERLHGAAGGGAGKGSRGRRGKHA